MTSDGVIEILLDNWQGLEMLSYYYLYATPAFPTLDPILSACDFLIFSLIFCPYINVIVFNTTSH